MKHHDLAESVMAQITADNINIKSKASIVFGSVMVGAGFAILTALTVIIVSLVMYQFQIFGTLGFLWFGLLGLTPFLHTVPWIWVFVSGVLIIAGYILLKRYDFSYKAGYRGILLVFCLCVLGLAFLVDKLGLHEQISHQPGMQQIYTVSVTDPHWMMGEVVIASPSGIIVMTPQHQQIVIHYSNNTKLPAGANFKPGSRVQTIGSFVEDFFEAEGINFK